MLERYQIGKSLPSEKRPYLRMEIKIYENAIGRQRSRVSFKFMCKSLKKCLHEESTCWKDLLFKTSRFSFSLLIRSSKHLGIALFQLLMEHWLVPEVIPPAVLYPLVQGGRRGRSIYGTARVIFSLQEGHGSSRHPHNHLKSSCGRGRSKNLDELGRYPLIGKVGTNL